VFSTSHTAVAFGINGAGMMDPGFGSAPPPQKQRAGERKIVDHYIVSPPTEGRQREVEDRWTN
jgi:hypothetical protein